MTLDVSVQFRGQRLWWRAENADTATEVTDGKITISKYTKIHLKTRFVSLHSNINAFTVMTGKLLV